jgi:hypothetical protein
VLGRAVNSYAEIQRIVVILDLQHFGSDNEANIGRGMGRESDRASHLNPTTNPIFFVRTNGPQETRSFSDPVSERMRDEIHHRRSLRVVCDVPPRGELAPLIDAYIRML